MAGLPLHPTYKAGDSDGKQKQESDEVCCPLSFPLQDLCLLAIMSNLDSYQVDLLALLPLQLRQRLLSILPALDLYRLEHTSVAAKVDVNEIWKSRPAPPAPPAQVKSNFRTSLVPVSSENSFQLSICSNKAHIKSDVLLKEIKSVFSDLSEFPRGKEIVFHVASDIFAGANPDLKKLISIEGDLVFSNLLSGSMHQPCQNSLCGQRAWKNQATALAVEHTRQTPYNNLAGEKVCLSPRYRCSTLNEHDDPLKLLSSLARECSLQPSSAFVDIDFIYNLLFPERLALDSGSTLPELSWTSTLDRILSKVIILKLKCNDYSNFRVMTGLVEAAIGYSQLKYLSCSMSNLYLDVVEPFWTLFSLPNFHQLTLKLDKLSPLMLCKLLHGFMTAKCSHVQKLMIDVKHNLVLPDSLQHNQLASLYKRDPSACSAEYKVFQLLPQEKYTHVLYLLLQLPTIRLKEIAFVGFSEYHEYLHLCTLHPDLQTTKLVIDMSCVTESSTIRADLISLFGMSSLRKIIISGCWGELDEVKLGLVQGLCSRARSHPLTKIAFQLTRSDHYRMKDFQMLCEAIFSLPNLENLKVVLGKGFADLIRQQRYEDILYLSWVRKSRAKLKSICLQTNKTELKHVQLTTQKLSFEKVQKQFHDYGDIQIGNDYNFFGTCDYYSDNSDHFDDLL